MLVKIGDTWVDASKINAAQGCKPAAKRLRSGDKCLQENFLKLF